MDTKHGKGGRFDFGDDNMVLSSSGRKGWSFAAAKSEAKVGLSSSKMKRVRNAVISSSSSGEGHAARAAVWKRAFGNQGGRLRVLVVEDDVRLRQAAVDALSKQGMVVGKTSSPEDLQRAMRRFKPDVVVLDDYFHRWNVESSDLMPRLIERFPGVRFVVTSELPPSQLETNPTSWGAADVVHKWSMFRDHLLERTVANAVKR